MQPNKRSDVRFYFFFVFCLVFFLQPSATANFSRPTNLPSPNGRPLCDYSTFKATQTVCRFLTNLQIGCMGIQTYELHPREICRKWQRISSLLSFKNTNCQFKPAALAHFLVFFPLSLSCHLFAASSSVSFPPNCSFLASSSGRSLGRKFTCICTSLLSRCGKK